MTRISMIVVISFDTIEIALRFRRICGGVVAFAANISGSDGDTLALADTSSAGVGAVELLAVPTQRVVDQMVDTGWIENWTYFLQRRRYRA